MRSHLAHFALLSILSVSVPLAACGGPPDVKTPSDVTSPTGTAPKGDATPPAPSTPGTSPAGTGASTPSTPPAPGEAKGPMKAIAASTMAEDLKKLGLDPKNLPPLNKVPPDKIRPLMMTFKKALGAECTACHDAQNFKAATPKKKIAAKMWDQLVRGLAMEDGSVLYCDSCHNGHLEFLDRHDKKALSAWMDQNFVSKVKRVDKKDHSCETCHGDPFEPKFLAAWAK